MSDDEEDYMSDKFLSGISDVRPSLVHNRAKKREYQMQQKHKEYTKKQKESTGMNSAVVTNEKLQEALSKPLESENKGFKLMAKMGFKPGQTLGKKTNPDDGETSALIQKRLVEPIGITIKSDRQGLGRETALRELMERRIQIRMDRMKKERDSGETSIEEFRKRATQKAEEKFVANAIRLCQKTCENLDVEFEIDTPAMPWFWPEKPKVESDENDEEQSSKTEDEEDNSEETDETEEFSNDEKLEMLTSYVRTSYNFCYWCGVRYENEQDMLDNCPGLTKDDH